MKRIVRLSLALLVVAGSLGAQSPDANKVTETKTVDLHHLKPQEAVNLLTPYLRSPRGSVTMVSDKISVVTLRDVPDGIAAMEQVLAKYDHTPATIRLVFQLIEADTGPTRLGRGGSTRLTPELDSTLRSVLKFPFYRLISQSVASAGENVNVSQELPTLDKGDSYWQFALSAYISEIRITDAPPGAERQGTVHLSVSLDRSTYAPPVQVNGPGMKTVIAHPTERIISTGLDVPLGQMIVLGTASTRSGGVALILTVKPELVPIKP